MTNVVKPTRLTTRDYAIIEDVGRFRFLSSYHLERRHFKTESKHRHIVTVNRLARLDKAGFLTKGYAYPKWVQGKAQHKIAVYTWLPANQNVLRKHLESAGRAHLWDAQFARHAERIPNTKTFSPYTLFHELLLTDFLLWLVDAATKDGWEVVFFERYGPREEDMTALFDTKNGVRRFNPDALVCLRNPQGRYFFRTAEADKDSTSQEGKFREKLEGHQLAQSSGHFADLLWRKIQAYNVPITEADAKTVNNVMLTVTHTRERRNELFIESIPLAERYRFLFACIEDLKADDGFDSVWLRGNEYFDTVMSRKDFPEHALPSVHKAWIAGQLETMPKVPMVPQG